MEAFFVYIRGNDEMIKLKNIKKIYNSSLNKVVAIDDISLSINEGEIYGIIGYSGAGKSTLIRMLNGLEKPTAGEVIIQNEDINKLSNKELRQKRQKIGMIFQHFNLLWSRTVKENISFPLEIAGIPKNERKKRVEELIQLVGLEGRENAYPAEISGGQKQRVGIARALANDPQILLCDEATSALDPQTTNEVLDLLLDINKKLNLTIVVITHEMDVVRKICNRVAVLEEGKLAEEGKVVDIFKNPKQTITKQFIQEDAQGDTNDISEILLSLEKQHPTGQILLLKFDGGEAQQPIITKISRKYEIDVNIIHGNIQSTKDSLIGSLYVQLLGETKAIKKAIQDIQELRVEMEVINHG